MGATGLERRLFERVILDKEVLAVLKPTFERMGRVINISKGGLAFEYSLLADQVDMSDEAVVELFMLNGQFYIHAIKCRVVYDATLYKQPAVSANFRLNSRKRCGVQFVELLDEQEKQISQLLDS